MIALAELTHLKAPRPAIPMPALAVPYAAPTVDNTICIVRPRPSPGERSRSSSQHWLHPQICQVSDAPELAGVAYPKNGAHGGQSSDIASEYGQYSKDSRRRWIDWTAVTLIMTPPQLITRGYKHVLPYDCRGRRQKVATTLEHIHRISYCCCIPLVAYGAYHRECEPRCREDCRKW